MALHRWTWFSEAGDCVVPHIPELLENWDSNVLQIKLHKKKSSTAGVSLLVKNKFLRFSQPVLIICVSTNFSRAGLSLAVTIPSVCFCVTRISTQEKLECFRIHQGRWGLFSHQRCRPVCGCISNTSRPRKLEFPLTCRTQDACE